MMLLVRLVSRLKGYFWGKNTIITLMQITAVCLLAYPLFLWGQAAMESRSAIRKYESLVGTQEAWESVERIPADEEPVWEELPPTILWIPSLRVETALTTAESIEEYSRLNHPPGYLPNTAMPGQGNVLIAGHRSGPAGHFRRLGELGKGDQISLRTPQAEYRYYVEWKDIVSPDMSDHQLPTSGRSVLTLITCQTSGTDASAYRLIVRAKLGGVYRRVARSIWQQ